MSARTIVLVSTDPLLTDEVQRLAAAAEARLDPVPTVEEALRRWAAARAVLVGADLLDDLAAAGPLRRAEVSVVVVGPATDGLFRAAVAVGATSVLELPAARESLVERLADLADEPTGRGVVLGVVGGTGGAGASVLAAATAAAAARAGAPTLLADLDPWGADVGRLCPQPLTAGVGWADLEGSRGRLGGRALREALPDADGLRVLGWGASPRMMPSAGLVTEVLAAAARGHSLVVVDLPRTDPALHEVVGSSCDHIALVVRPTVTGALAAARVTASLARHAPSVGVVARCRVGSPLGTEVAHALQVPLWGEVPDQRRLEEQVDLGLGVLASRRAPLAHAAVAVLTHLGVETRR